MFPCANRVELFRSAVSTHPQRKMFHSFYILLLVSLIAFIHAEEPVDLDECESCRFFPTVCENIDMCVEKCNIAPSMASSCEEL